MLEGHLGVISEGSTYWRRLLRKGAIVVIVDSLYKESVSVNLCILVLKCDVRSTVRKDSLYQKLKLVDLRMGGVSLEFKTLS